MNESAEGSAIPTPSYSVDYESALVITMKTIESATSPKK
jgi:hypothetical protein